jgi:penicillin-binding protein 1A
MRRVLNVLAALVVVAVTPVASVGVVFAALLFLPLPAELPERVPPAPSQISRVYDIAGNEIASYKQFETSIPVEPGDIPEVLKQAVIAAEDRSFYDHGGIDVRSTMRALWTDLRDRSAVQGGSTITQQLVKNTVTGSERTIERKVREAILAAQLDRAMDKEDILFEYLSIIYLGEGAYGVGAAAETYFRKPVSELTLSESALLAGVIPAPSRYSPRVDPEAAEGKRRIVLQAMRDEDMISEQELRDAWDQRVWLSSWGMPEDTVTVVQPPLEQHSTDPYFSDYVFRWLEQHLPGGRDQILQGGLRIETTIDPVLQMQAHAEVQEFLDGTEPDLWTSLVAVEPPTGFVRAFVSGRDWEATQVNIAIGTMGGGSGRQPGSAFKPFVLAEAFNQGITPEEVYSGAPHDVGADRPIGNYGGSSYGNMPLRSAMWSSVNTVFTRLILDVGVDETLTLAKRMGLRAVSEFDPSVHGASIALGTEPVSPLEMASAYGVFANHGLRVPATPVLVVYDRNGEVVLDNREPQGSRVLSDEVADNVTDVLQGVLTSGTAQGRGIDRPAAGKTGTTNSNRDAWFVGYTPTLSTAVWMGYENRTLETTKELVNIKGVATVTGGSHPAAIWQSFMTKALADVPVTEFNEPAPIKPVVDGVTREERRGFELLAPMRRDGVAPGGPYVSSMGAPGPPMPAPPPTTATTAPPTTSTTTTSTQVPTTSTTAPPQSTTTSQPTTTTTEPPAPTTTEPDGLAP